MGCLVFLVMMVAWVISCLLLISLQFFPCFCAFAACALKHRFDLRWEIRIRIFVQVIFKELSVSLLQGLCSIVDLGMVLTSQRKNPRLQSISMVVWTKAVLEGCIWGSKHRNVNYLSDFQRSTWRKSQSHRVSSNNSKFPRTC